MTNLSPQTLAHLTAPPPAHVSIGGKLYSYPQGDVLMAVPTSMLGRLAAGDVVLGSPAPGVTVIAAPQGKNPFAPPAPAPLLHLPGRGG